MKTMTVYVFVVVTLLAAAIALFGLLAAGGDRDGPAGSNDTHPRAMTVPF